MIGCCYLVLWFTPKLARYFKNMPSMKCDPLSFIMTLGRVCDPGSSGPCACGSATALFAALAQFGARLRRAKINASAWPWRNTARVRFSRAQPRTVLAGWFWGLQGGLRGTVKLLSCPFRSAGSQILAGSGSGRERRGHTQTEHKSVTVLWNCGGPGFLPRVASCLQNPPSESKAVPTLQHHLHQQHQHLQNREEVYHIQRAKKTLGYQRWP
jgi:hypothetical protein